jgi:secondary thiamine-phosphate synthase enzyme
MIQENWDESVQQDVLNFLCNIIPNGVWQHDAQDGNGDAHHKAGIVGPLETVPLINGKLGLSRWQNIFFASSMVHVVSAALLLPCWKAAD